MKTKSFDILNTVLCIFPILFFLLSIVYPFKAGLQFEEGTQAYWLALLFLILCIICLLFTLVCVLARFVLYVIECYRLNPQYTLKSVVRSFVREPYHNIFERISDVVMTLQAVLALLVFLLYIKAGGPL